MKFSGIYEGLISGKEKLALVGLGYVDMPIAVEFAKHIHVIGFDINEKRIEEYKSKVKSINFDSVISGLNALMSEFSVIMNNGETPESSSSMTLVNKLQNYITDNFYTCTKEILYGLGIMYVCDERFKNNIDKNSVGTSEFIKKAIEAYCLK